MISAVKNIFFWLFIISIGFIVACSDDAAMKEEEKIQARADSITQAKLDSAIISEYISNPANSIDVSKLDTATNGLIYGLLASGVGTFPQINNIVSVNYIGKFTDNAIFDTSIKSLAIDTDSLAWVDLGVDFTADTVFVADDTVVIKNKDIKEALNLLSRTSKPLPITVFSINRVYTPILYNYTEDGNFITGFIQGFKQGLTLLTPQMDLGARSLILLPSALGYGINGSGSVIDPNTVILFEFNMVYIR